MVIYVLYLIAKALKTYINSNNKNNKNNKDNKDNKDIYEEMPKVKTRKPLKGLIMVAICNVLIIIALIATISIQRNHDIYYTKNVILLQSKSDVEKCTILLEENDIEYEVLRGTRIKMQSRDDFLEAVEIVKNNSFSFSTITVEE